MQFCLFTPWLAGLFCAVQGRILFCSQSSPGWSSVKTGGDQLWQADSVRLRPPSASVSQIIILSVWGGRWRWLNYWFLPLLTTDGRTREYKSIATCSISEKLMILVASFCSGNTQSLFIQAQRKFHFLASLWLWLAHLIQPWRKTVSRSVLYYLDVIKLYRPNRYI